MLSSFSKYVNTTIGHDSIISGRKGITENRIFSEEILHKTLLIVESQRSGISDNILSLSPLPIFDSINTECNRPLFNRAEKQDFFPYSSAQYHLSRDKSYFASGIEKTFFTFSKTSSIFCFVMLFQSSAHMSEAVTQA